MQSFRTELTAKESEKKISLRDSVLTIGSCFASTLGENLILSKFNVLNSPFGTVYNPLSLHKLLNYAIDNHAIAPHTFLELNNIHFNYDFHSTLSALSQSELEEMLVNKIDRVHHFLKNTRWLIITFGTAWMHIRKDIGDVVANCHKVPADQFEKELCTQKRMLDSFEELYTKLKTFNPNLDIILTVSPVRHLKDTLELNSVSKSVLRLACHTLTQQHTDVYYFPAYEILLDDLRDYRFYKSDMIHPSAEAEEYIWTKFCSSYFDDKTMAFLEKWKKIRAGLNHKPFHVTSSAHQAFLLELLSQLNEVRSQVSVDKEIEFVKDQLV